MTDETAELFNEITYRQVLERQLRVMDASAISLCMDNNLPIIVFNMRESGNIRRVVTGERGVGTKVG
jgi:uridylate kinase